MRAWALALASCLSSACLEAPPAGSTPDGGGDPSDGGGADGATAQCVTLLDERFDGPGLSGAWQATDNERSTILVSGGEVLLDASANASPPVGAADILTFDSYPLEGASVQAGVRLFGTGEDSVATVSLWIDPSAHITVSLSGGIVTAGSTSGAVGLTCQQEGTCPTYETDMRIDLSIAWSDGLVRTFAAVDGDDPVALGDFTPLDLPYKVRLAVVTDLSESMQLHADFVKWLQCTPGD